MGLAPSRDSRVKLQPLDVLADMAFFRKCEREPELSWTLARRHVSAEHGDTAARCTVVYVATATDGLRQVITRGVVGVVDGQALVRFGELPRQFAAVVAVVGEAALDVPLTIADGPDVRLEFTGPMSKFFAVLVKLRDASASSARSDGVALAPSDVLQWMHGRNAVLDVLRTNEDLFVSHQPSRAAAITSIDVEECIAR